MNNTSDIRKMADNLREAAVILDDIATNLEDENLTEEERDKKEELLLAQFMVKMMKLNQMQL